MNDPDLLWTPSPARVDQAGLTRFRRWLERERGLRFDGYEALWQWSIDHLEDFWEAIWRVGGVVAHAPYARVVDRRVMPGARWFEGSTLNFAEHLLLPSRRPDRAGHPCLVFESELRSRQELAWSEVAGQVGALSEALDGRTDIALEYRPAERIWLEVIARRAPERYAELNR